MLIYFIDYDIYYVTIHICVQRYNKKRKFEKYEHGKNTKTKYYEL